MVSLIFILLITLCVIMRDTVITGAAEGLLIWYRNVVPVLLPFMILTRFYISRVHLKNKNRSLAIFMVVLIGVFCGYPMGAVVASSYLEQGTLERSTCQNLLPICSNLSPMFLAGYIHKQILQEAVPLPLLFIVIYLPSILLSTFLLLMERRKKIPPVSENKEMSKETKSESDLLTACIRQITVIGLYIMIFSILLEILLKFMGGSLWIKIFAGQMEITKGSLLISRLSLPFNIKTALIMGTAAFGGISAIYQTKDAMQHSGLSVIHYVICKILCAFASGIFIYLIL